MDEEAYRDDYGVRMHKSFRQECVRSAINYRPREGDIFVVSYPKSGTNWMVLIIWNIITRAKGISDCAEYAQRFRNLEMSGGEAADNPARIEPIMTHLPMKVFRPVKHGKYIYVARNPYDSAVSSYYRCKGQTPKTVTDVSFGKFLSLFITEKLMYGDYFDHLLPWYERRHDTNVLFITYEQLKSDTEKHVQRIADFLGEAHGAALREDQGLMKRVLQASSMESMKAILNEKRSYWIMKAATSARLKAAQSTPEENVEMHEMSPFIRKGVVGDWKNHFTSDQIALMKAWIGKKSKGSDVMELWKDFDLP